MKKYIAVLLCALAVLFAFSACDSRPAGGIVVIPGGGNDDGNGGGGNTELDVPENGIAVGDEILTGTQDLATVLESAAGLDKTVTLGSGTYQLTSVPEKLPVIEGNGKDKTIIEIPSAVSASLSVEEKISNVTIRIGEEPAAATARVLAASTFAAPTAANELLKINSDNVVFDGVNIEVFGSAVMYNVITVNADNFTFQNGSITGQKFTAEGTETDEYFGDTDYSNVNMGIAIAAGTTGTKITNSTFDSNYTPVYTSSPDFTFDTLTFDSGIELETVSEKSVITGCRKLTDDDSFTAKINVMTKAGSLVTDYEAANEARERFLEANPGLDSVRLNDHKADAVIKNYVHFGSQNILNDVRTALVKEEGSYGMVITSVAAVDNENGDDVATITYDLTDYNYATSKEPKFVTGTVTATYTGTITDGTLTATSWTMEASGLKLSDSNGEDGAAAYQKVNDVAISCSGDFGTSDNGSIAFTVEDGKVTALATPASTGDYTAASHQFQFTAGEISIPEFDMNDVDISTYVQFI